MRQSNPATSQQRAAIRMAAVTQRTGLLWTRSQSSLSSAPILLVHYCVEYCAFVSWWRATTIWSAKSLPSSNPYFACPILVRPELTSCTMPSRAYQLYQCSEVCQKFLWRKRCCYLPGKSVFQCTLQIADCCSSEAGCCASQCAVLLSPKLKLEYRHLECLLSTMCVNVCCAKKTL